jgi:hypothetical protein
LHNSLCRTGHKQPHLSRALDAGAALARKRNDWADAEKIERRARECDDRSRKIRDLLQDATAFSHHTTQLPRSEALITRADLLNLCKCV